MRGALGIARGRPRGARLGITSACLCLGLLCVAPSFGSFSRVSGRQLLRSFGLFRVRCLAWSIFSHGRARELIKRHLEVFDDEIVFSLLRHVEGGVI